MTVALPTSPGIRSAKVRLLDFGGNLTPSLGGPVQRINRLGTRTAIDFTLPPMATEPHGRQWAAIINRATREGACYPVPQPGLAVGAPGSPTVSGAVSGGSANLPVTGGTPNYVYRPGQAVSVTHGGKRYLYFVEIQAIADCSGAAVLPLDRLLRTSLINGDAVNVSKPLIEGAFDFSGAFDLLLEPYTQLAFSITEQA